MREIQLKNTKRKNAQQLYNYLLSKIDFQELEQLHAMPIYYSAAEWFAENLGNSTYVNLEDEDIETLLTLRTGSKQIEEICNITGFSPQSVRSKINKLLMRGLVFSYIEQSNKQNRNNYYKLTPYGDQELKKELLNN